MKKYSKPVVVAKNLRLVLMLLVALLKILAEKSAWYLALSVTPNVKCVRELDKFSHVN